MGSYLLKEGKASTFTVVCCTSITPVVPLRGFHGSSFLWNGPFRSREVKTCFLYEKPNHNIRL